MLKLYPRLILTGVLENRGTITLYYVRFELKEVPALWAK